MRVAIYNRWLHIGGGGERHACAIAAALAPEHAVTLLTHQLVGLPWLAERLALDLTNVALSTLPDSAHNRLVAEASAQYDLFVNASHGDLFAPRAHQNALLVFFPGPLAEPTPPAGPIALLSGCYQVERGPHGPYRWTDGKATLRLAPLPLGSRLRLRVCGMQPPGWPAAEVWVRDASGTTLERRVLPNGKPTYLAVPLPKQICVEGGELTLESSFFVPAWMGGSDWRALGVQLLQAQPLRGIAWRWDATSNVAALGDGATAHHALDAYHQIWANSRYTQGWIARRWGRTSGVLYPPVAVAQFAPAPKQHTILNVGRFFTGLHNKGQLELVRAFAALCNAGLRGWTLHLVGAIDTTQPAHLAYLDDVRAAAKGYPVEIATNVAQEQVRALYARSALYWHAAGLGANPEREPERCEHFGISVVEAMAAGCVPLVYACGGPSEIVGHGVHGFLWRTSDELRQQTQALAADPAQRAALADAARARSHAFGWQPFVANLRQLALRSDGQPVVYPRPGAE
jgi:glycosyltransferase involved in cell wall biosynthesis